jgi:hypothetical protein
VAKMNGMRKYAKKDKNNTEKYKEI